MPIPQNSYNPSIIKQHPKMSQAVGDTVNCLGLGEISEYFYQEYSYQAIIPRHLQALVLELLNFPDHGLTILNFSN
ncbi:MULTISPECIES: hypothetical protein [Moorena]|uniref:hypothetical protein n=1 Tax=Moorena TaxID=1155738 RepID=UPI001055D3E5|nr:MULTISPECIES: hypothetical protein [Moorena]NER88806.1 hypothetical protein [Moorena sp. SIO3A2]